MRARILLFLAALCMASPSIAADPWPATVGSRQCSEAFFAQNADGNYIAIVGTTDVPSFASGEEEEVFTGTQEWQEVVDTQGEWDPTCNVTLWGAGAIQMDFTRSGASAVKFYVSCTLSSGADAGSRYQNIMIRHADAETVVGGTIVGSRLVGYAAGVDGVQTSTISGVVTIDDGDCVGVSTTNGFLGLAFEMTTYNASCIIREIGECS